MSKKYAHALLDEEVKEDNIKSKSKSSVRTSTNEGPFKQPPAQVTLTKRSGGSTSGMSSGAKDPLNTSASSASQPQHLQASPSVDERMGDLHIEGAGSMKRN